MLYEKQSLTEIDSEIIYTLHVVSKFKMKCLEPFLNRQNRFT